MNPLRRILLLIGCILVLWPSVAFGLQRHFSKEGVQSRKTATRLFNEHEVLGPIFYPRSAGEQDPEYLAALELAEVLAQVSGQEWEVLPEEGTGAKPGVYVGHTVRYFIESGQTLRASRDALSRQPRDPDQYFLFVDDECVIIGGNTRAATVRAVSRFLMEQADVWWFIPGPLGVSIPAREEMYVAAQSTWQVPDFASRWLRVRDVAWNRHNMLDRWIPSQHGLFKLLDEEALSEHPEWMPLVNGMRELNRSGGTFAHQPEIADPQLAAFIARRVDEKFLSDLAEPSVSIGMNDTLIYSESELSRAALLPWSYYRGLPNTSELVFAFSNAVAQQSFGLKHSYPVPRYVSQLAYYMHLEVPSFKVDPGVAVYVATDRGQWYDPERDAEGKALLDDWAETAQGPWGLRDYYYGHPYLIPRIYTGLMAESIAYGHSAGASLFMAESNPQWGYDGPKIWLVTQLAQNSRGDADALLEEYYARFYGPAAGPMSDFFALCEKQWMEQPGKAKWIKYFLNPAQLALFSPEVCEQLDVYLKEAERRARVDTREPWADRVALTRECFDQTRAASVFYHAWLTMAKNPLATEEDRERFLAAWPEYEQARSNVLDHMPKKLPTWLKMMWNTLIALDPRPRLEAGAWRGVTQARARFDQSTEGELTCGESLSRDWALPGGWSVSATNGEGFSWQILQVDGDESVMRVEGANSFSLNRLLPVRAGEGLGVRVKLRGALSPGCQVYLLVSWWDAEGEKIERFERAALPEGDFTEWMSIVVNTRVPKGAQEAYLSLKVRAQFPGDWLEVDDVLAMGLAEASMRMGSQRPAERSQP